MNGLLRSSISHVNLLICWLTFQFMLIHCTLCLCSAGAFCDELCPSIGQLAGLWGKPVISYGCGSDELSDKQLYPTFARMLAPVTKLAPLFAQIMEHFEWDRVIIIMTGDHIWHLTSNAITKHMSDRGITVYSTYQVTLTNTAGTFTPEQALQQGKENSRVFLLCMYPIGVYGVIGAASKLGMLNGENVFLSINADQSKLEAVFMNTLGEDHDHRRRRQAQELTGMAMLRGLLDVTTYEPVNDAVYDGFIEEVKTIMTNGSLFNATMMKHERVDVVAELIYDSVFLVAYALNQALDLGLPPSDAYKYMFNRSFTGIDGHVTIDVNGDRDPNYMLRNLQHDAYLTVGQYLSEDGIFTALNDTVIHWPGGGTVIPIGRPTCGWNNELCQDHGPDLVLSITLSMVFALVLVLLVLLIVFYRFRKKEADLKSMAWRINPKDLVYTKNEKSSRNSSQWNIGASGVSLDSNKTEGNVGQLFCGVANYKSSLVAVRKLVLDNLATTKAMQREMNEARILSHVNINPFIGACLDPCLLVTTYCGKGSLQDVLESDNLKLDWTFKLAFGQDIAKGMDYLHRSDCQVHGRLKSTNVLVDNRMQCKVSDFGLPLLRCLADAAAKTNGNHQRLLWTAPEILRQTRPIYTQKSDSYSFGIIMQELAVQSEPYEMYDMDSVDIVNSVKKGTNPPFRPKVSEECPDGYYHTMVTCWDEDPSTRPTFKEVLASFRRTNKGKEANLVETMIRMMERYATRLEEIVEERTSQLATEQKRTEELLGRMLPRSVAGELKAGRTVTPEYFDHVTIYFSDIVGFTGLSSDSTPMQVVNLLNDLYTCFDTIMDKYDVYKVETIGDAYMVVSGLPERNGDRHAGEVASLSLDLLSAIKTFRIRHRPNEKLRLRIGMHSGSCVAGVVGLMMPRYCLFGDTVNYASRMESNGLPMMIHLSPECKKALDKLGGFKCVVRGEVELKGKGKIISFFLVGKLGDTGNVDDEEDPLDEIENMLAMA